MGPLMGIRAARAGTAGSSEMIIMSLTELAPAPERRVMSVVLATLGCGCLFWKH